MSLALRGVPGRALNFSAAAVHSRVHHPAELKKSTGGKRIPEEILLHAARARTQMALLQLSWRPDYIGWEMLQACKAKNRQILRLHNHSSITKVFDDWLPMANYFWDCTFVVEALHTLGYPVVAR